MKWDRIITLTNRVALAAIVLLIFWVFAFISITVFDFKVFIENITQSFYLSILGILALLSGAVIVNVMFNLTKISSLLSSQHDDRELGSSKKGGIWLFVGILLFPLIFLLLYLGDIQTSKQKENHLVESAEYIVERSRDNLTELSEFVMDSTYFSEVQSDLSVLSMQLEGFPSVSLILAAKYDNETVFIDINRYSRWQSMNTELNYVYRCSAEEMEYLTRVFGGEETSHRFSSSDGKYELYYPVDLEDRKLVLYCTDYQKYGKVGY